MLTIFYSFLQLWATFAAKLMKSPTMFFTYIQSSTLFLHVYKISWSPIYVKKNAAYFNMLTRACLFQQLWTIFWTKIVKNPSIFVTYIFTLFQFLHAHIILLRSRFYNKNDRGFNVANKLLLISKSVFIAPCFKCVFLFMISISAISAKHYNALANLSYETFFFTALWTLKIENFNFAFFVLSILDYFHDKTYEKSCYFYNMYSNCISNSAGLRNFPI